MISQLHGGNIRRRVEAFKILLTSFLGLLILLVPPANHAQKPAKPKKVSAQPSAVAAPPTTAIWTPPIDIRTRNLYYGPGGKNGQPKGKMTFIKEDMDATSPKFVVEDEAGVKWKVKLGPEAQPETVATRLLWAAGFFVDESYYMAQIKVEKLPRLNRGRQFVYDGGFVRGARLERDPKGDKKIGDWDWFENPFVGTTELSGLQVMMALINNWDLKKENNSIRPRQGVAQAYYVSDLGASFGQNGNVFTRSKNDLSDYKRSKFIRKVYPDSVDFNLKTRPFFLFIVYPPYYISHAKRERLAKGIPRAAARWIGDLLGQLSPEQIGDAFRAAGYSSDEVAEYTGVVIQRINELQHL